MRAAPGRVLRRQTGASDTAIRGRSDTRCTRQGKGCDVSVIYRAVEVLRYVSGSSGVVLCQVVVVLCYVSGSSGVVLCVR